MRMIALGCRGEQAGVAQLAEANEFVADGCCDLSFVKGAG